MADVVVYEDSPLAQYLHDLQVEQPTHELQYAPVPVHEPPPPPDSLTKRIADNACGVLGSIVDYLSEAFSSSSTEVEDAEFEERFKYLICTSPFLNRAATLHAHERGRGRTDGSNNTPPDEIEYNARYFSPGRFGYSLGFGSLVALAAHTVLGRTRIGRAPWFRPMFVRPMATGIALATSLWVIRLLRRRRTQRTQRRALRSLQLLVHHCHTLDSRANRAMMVVQEIELVSRGYRLSTPLAPISRIEQASKTRRCNLVRAQLLSTLDTSSALFQRATETLQSHIDEKRLHTLLDMYNITSSSSHPDSPVHDDDTVVDMSSLRSPGFSHHDSMLGSVAGDPAVNNGQQDPHIIVASPTHDSASSYQAFYNGNMASSTAAATSAPDTGAGCSTAPPQRSRNSINLGRRRRRASSTISPMGSRPSSFHEGTAVAPGSRPSSFYEGTFAAAMMGHQANHSPATASSATASRSRSRPPRRHHHTSWSSGEESDNGTLQLPSMTMMMMAAASPRSSIYSTTNTSTTPTTAVQEPPSPPGMTSLERLRRNYQRMHGHRREFLCELMSIRRKSRQERHGIHQVLKDYDKNWSVAATVLENGVVELENLLNELTKVLDEELYTLPRIDTGAQTAEDSATNKQIQPFVQRLALMEQSIRGIQAKLYICNQDIKDAVRPDASDTDKRRLLELQFDSISQDIDMISTEWQLGKSALTRALDPQSCGATQGAKAKINQDSDDERADHSLLEQALTNTDQAIRQVYDALEHLDDPQRLHALTTTQEEVFEASTDAASMAVDRRTGLGVHRADGTKMTRAERIAYQKAQREQEEMLRERSRVTFRMVDELKNVLGQRRHLREGEVNTNNNNNNKTEEFPVSTTTTTTTGATGGTTITTTITITATTPAPISLTMPSMMPSPTAYPIAESLASPTIAPSESCYPSDDETPKGERPAYFADSSYFEEESVPLDQPMEELTAWTTTPKTTTSSLTLETLHRSSEELQQE